LLEMQNGGLTGPPFLFAPAFAWGLQFR
jgi:hypothetical protein